MSKIVVTGGAGRLGRRVIEDLLARGAQVLSVDCVRPEKLQCRFVRADLTEPAAVYDVLQGADAVLHLGAIPGPTIETSAVTFRNNVLSTYNVAEAAAALRLRKLVFASSMFAAGWHESPEAYWPKYAPLDEEHPLTPFEGYGLSKQVGEDICAAVSRRTGMPSVSLRIMNVIQLGGYDAFPWPAPTREKGVRFVMWPYVDVRDAARACRLALEAETQEHEAMYIAAADTRFAEPTLRLLQNLAPQVTVRGALDGCASVISTKKAERLISYRPEHGWRAERN